MSEVSHDAACYHEVENPPKPTINDIFRMYGPAYLKKYKDRMSVDQIKAMFTSLFLAERLVRTA